MGKMDEVILVAKRADLFGEFDEMSFVGVEVEDEFVNRLNGILATKITTMRRGDAEEDPTYKQPIPYCVLRRGDEIFTYTRLTGGGEARLHGRISIGAGGHMNAIGSDAVSFEQLLSDNLERELNEELEIVDDKDIEIEPKLFGFINDDSDDVGKVHLGVLVVIDLPLDAQVDVQETDQLKGGWMTLGELLLDDFYHRLENWSKMAVDALWQS